MGLRILLPTDFSSNSWHAIQYAKALYAHQHCDFFLLNAFEPSVKGLIDKVLYEEPGNQHFKRAKARSDEGLTEALDALMFEDTSNPKHHFQAISMMGDPLDVIKEVVEAKDIEMIVMGTKGASGSLKVVYGSVAINVMEKVRSCPVIVVPENAKTMLPKEIVFPTGFKIKYKERELKVLIDIAVKTKATVIVLHVSKDIGLEPTQIESKKMLETYFKDIPSQYHTLSHNDVQTAVNVFVESRDSDMVAFINRKHRFFGSILTQPMVKGITFHSKVPILVIHDLRN